MHYDLKTQLNIMCKLWVLNITLGWLNFTSRDTPLTEIVIIIKSESHGLYSDLQPSSYTQFMVSVYHNILIQSNYWGKTSK
jgi:hypothetical protein